MLPRPPVSIAVEAGRLDLGRPERTYRAWRFSPPRAAWLGAGAGLVLAVPLFALGAPVLGAVLVPLAALGAAAAAALLRPPGGHRWFAVFERGFVDARQGGACAARWEWLRDGIEFAPEGIALTVAPPAADVAPAQVVLGGLEPADDLLLLLRERAPRPPAEADPTAPDPAALRAEDARRRRRRLAASAAGLAVVALLPGLAYATIDPTGGEPAAAPSPRRTPAFLPTRGPRPAPPTLPPPPAPTFVALPENIYGYSTVCDGTGFADAAPYRGRGPHPVYVAENFVQGPARWYSKDPEKIQLVACVETRLGRVVDRCRYFGDGTQVVQDMVVGRYTLVLREARTARVVGRARIDGSDAECLVLLYGRRDPDEQQVTKPTKAQITRALRRYVD